MLYIYEGACVCVSLKSVCVFNVCLFQWPRHTACSSREGILSFWCLAHSWIGIQQLEIKWKWSCLYIACWWLGIVRAQNLGRVWQEVLPLWLGWEQIMGERWLFGLGFFCYFECFVWWMFRKDVSFSGSTGWQGRGNTDELMSKQRKAWCDLGHHCGLKSRTLYCQVM